MIAARLNEVPVQTGRSTIWESDAVTECKDSKKTENKKSTLMMRKKTRRNQKRGKAMQSAMPTIRESSEIVDDFAEIMANIDDNSQRAHRDVEARAGTAAHNGTQCSAGAREGDIAQVDLAALMGTQSSTKAIEHMVGSAALMGTQNPAKVAEKVGGRLSMLAWCAEGIKSIGDDGWEEIDFAVDSGGE